MEIDLFIIGKFKLFVKLFIIGSKAICPASKFKVGEKILRINRVTLVLVKANIKTR